MRDVKADWKRWSGAERIVAISATALSLIVSSSLLLHALIA